MAERRFISKQIFTDDEFTDLEVQTRLLYVYLILNADDDGMLKNAKQMMFLAGADKNDLQTLVDAGYLYDFSSGVYVIRHWNMMNKVQPSRKADTIYQKEKSELHIVNDVYCRQDVDKVSTQDSIGKDSIGKGSIGQGSTGQENLGQDNSGKVTSDDDDASSPHQNELDIALQKAIDEISNNPTLKELIQLFKSDIAPIRKPADVIALCDLYKIYGKQPLLMAMAKTKQKGGNSVEYLCEVIESQNE